MRVGYLDVVSVTLRGLNDFRNCGPVSPRWSSRRAFFQQVGAAGLSAAGAEALTKAADKGERGKGSPEDAKTGGAHAFHGTGSELMVEQLRAAEVKSLFTNPGSLEVGFFDALAKQDAVESVVACMRAWSLRWRMDSTR